MEIKAIGMAGTLESSDISIVIEPSESGSIDIELNSSVEKQFGNQIRKVIKETLEEIGIKKVKVNANDKGALDCIIRARVQAAAYRAAKIKEYKW